MLSKMNKKLKYTLAFVIVLIIGFIMGFVVSDYYVKNKIYKSMKQSPNSITERVLKKLDLEKDQRNKAKKLIGDFYKSIHENGEDFRDKVRELRDSLDKDIKDLLNPNQYEKYEKLGERYLKVHKKMMERNRKMWQKRMNDKMKKGKRPPHHREGKMRNKDCDNCEKRDENWKHKKGHKQDRN
jgi:5-bromo-4-chloroindolyl phosphate hydrolysis protein